MAAECIEAEGVLYIPVLVVGVADIFSPADVRVDSVLCVVLTNKNRIAKDQKFRASLTHGCNPRNPPSSAVCAVLEALRCSQLF